MSRTFGLALTLALVASTTTAGAADISIAAKKLVISGKVAGRAKAVFSAKDAGITKGSGTDPTQIEGQLDVSYDSASGQFLAPAGPLWQLNTPTTAKYKNPTAPTGGSVKTTQVKPGKVLKLAAKSFGDTPIDISAPPTAGVLAVYSLTNGAESFRFCTSFTVCKHKVTGGGTGYILSCKAGVPAACPLPPTTTTSSSSTTTSSSSTTSTSDTSTTSTSATSTTSTSDTTTTSTSESTTTTTESTTSTTESTTSTTESTTSTTESTTSTTESTTSTTESTTSTTESTTSTTESTTSTSTSSTSTSSSSSTSTSSTSTSSSSTSTTSTSTSTSSSSTSTTSSTTTTSTSSTTTTTAPLVGPSLPPTINGGSVAFNVTGASAGNAGGSTVNFTSFSPTTSWTQLFWGPSSSGLPTAGLDGSQHALPLSGISGTTATWAGTTSWTNPTTGTTHTGVPIRVSVTITGLGANPWALSTNIPQLDPGVGTGIGAVVSDAAGTPFSANTQFMADIPTDGAGNFIALNTVQNGGGKTVSSFTGAFYTRVP